jgi:hypothetical protein
MTGGNILRLLALAGILSLTGCRAFCERHYPETNYAPNSGCAPQPCCTPASYGPVQAQPCAPAPGAWNVPAR